MSRRCNRVALLVAAALAAACGPALAGPATTTTAAAARQCALEIRRYLANVRLPEEAVKFASSRGVDWKQVAAGEPLDELAFRGIRWPRNACESVIGQAERLSKAVPCSQDLELDDGGARDIAMGDPGFWSFWTSNIACVLAKDNSEHDAGASDGQCLGRVMSFAEGVRLPKEVKHMLAELRVDWDALLTNDDDELEPAAMKLPGGRPAKCGFVKSKVGQLLKQHPCFERLDLDDERVATAMLQHENLKWFLAANIACELVY